MLVTILEIVAFMVAATVLGLLLGWVLRGMFGKEQVELSDVRAQLRKLKRAQREQEAESQEKVAKEVKQASGSQSAKVMPEKQAQEPAAEKSEVSAVVKPAVVKPMSEKSKSKTKAGAKKASGKSAKKSSGPRKTVAEREADQAAARLAFAEVAERVGQTDVQDNLTKIYGVGKRYAEMLNELGLSSYAQIAKFRKADVKTLAGALGILDDRIESEDWVSSAKSLLKAAK